MNRRPQTKDLRIMNRYPIYLISQKPDMFSTTTISTRPLGKTGIQVTLIRLGVMELAGGGGLFGRTFPVIPPSDKNAIIQAALVGRYQLVRYSGTLRERRFRALVGRRSQVCEQASL
jgi:hypothetical protein